MDRVSEHRPDETIHRRRADAGVLPDLRQHIDRECQVSVGELLTDDFTHAFLMRWIQEGPHEADGYRVHTGFFELLDSRADIFFLEGRQHLTGGSDPLFYRDPELTRNQHLRRRVVKVVTVSVFFVGQAELERILMALGAEQTELRAFVLNQGVQTDRRSINDVVAVGEELFLIHFQAVAYLDEPFADRLRGVLRSGGGFRQLPGAVFAKNHEVGKRASGVDSELIPHGALCLGIPHAASWFLPRRLGASPDR